MADFPLGLNQRVRIRVGRRPKDRHGHTRQQPCRHLFTVETLEKSALHGNAPTGTSRKGTHAIKHNLVG